MAKIELRVGDRYPGMANNGVMVNLFPPGGGALLRIGADRMARAEIGHFARSEIDAVVRPEGSLVAIDWLFDALNVGTSTFDGVAARREGMLRMPDLHPASTIDVELHVVETATRLLRVLRTFRLQAPGPWRAAQIVRAALAKDDRRGGAT